MTRPTAVRSAPEEPRSPASDVPFTQPARRIRQPALEHPAMPPRRAAMPLGQAKPVLERLYRQFDRVESAADPIHLVRRYADPVDQEVAGFCAAALAFGRVASVVASIEALLRIMGPSPARFVRHFEPTRPGRSLTSFRHRWTGGDDLVMLFVILRRMIDSDGSIEGFFLRGYRSDADDVGSAVDSFCARALDLVDPARSPGVRYFFPKPAAGSACKRLNLYLRWMVRRDRIDFGVWRRVATSKLVVPLDTHVMRVGQCLRLTRYRSPGWPMAREITATLRQLEPDDPVKYDFSLCHLGMQDLCGFNRPQRDVRCPLRGLCRPAGRRPEGSRRPSGRR